MSTTSLESDLTAFLVRLDNYSTANRGEPPYPWYFKVMDPSTAAVLQGVHKLIHISSHVGDKVGCLTLVYQKNSQGYEGMPYRPALLDYSVIVSDTVDQHPNWEHAEKLIRYLSQVNNPQDRRHALSMYNLVTKLGLEYDSTYTSPIVVIVATDQDYLQDGDDYKIGLSSPRNIKNTF